MSIFFPEDKEHPNDLRDLGVTLDFLEDKKLTEREEEFVADMQDKLATYGENARLSEAQWDWIDRLRDKYDAHP